MTSVAKLFEELEARADALKTYREILTNPAYSDASQGMIVGGQPDYYKQQARSCPGVAARPPRQSAQQCYRASPSGNAAGGVVAIDLMLGLGETNPSPLRPLDSPIAACREPQGFAPRIGGGSTRI